MKKNLITICTLLVLVFAGTACSKKKSGGVVATTPTYTYNQYGQCVDQYGTVQSNTALCNNSGYHYNGNGQCVDQNGNVVAQNLCTNSGQYTYQYDQNANCCYRVDQYGNRTFYQNGQCPVNPNSQRCYGWHAWVDPYTGQIWDVECRDDYYGHGNNCSGYDLYSYQTGSFVYCQ